MDQKSGDRQKADAGEQIQPAFDAAAKNPPAVDAAALGQQLLDALNNSKNIPLALQLIEAGADVNAKTWKGTTPLIRATDNNKPQVVAALLAKGAELNHLDEWGYTALITAAYRKNIGLAEMLIAAGADTEPKNQYENDAMFWAERHHTPEIVQMIADARIDRIVTPMREGSDHEIKPMAVLKFRPKVKAGFMGFAWA